MQGWLGAERMAEILATDSFVCHKKTDYQCAGHMLIKGGDNAFVSLAQIDHGKGDTSWLPKLTLSRPVI